jgi:hypothetical protein
MPVDQSDLHATKLEHLPYPLFTFSSGNSARVSSS